MAATKTVSEAFHVDKETDEVMGETSDEVDPQQAILCLESILVIIFFFSEIVFKTKWTNQHVSLR